MTASHVERTVRRYRQVNKDIDTPGDSGPDRLDPYRERFVKTHWNHDGTLSLEARLPPAEGATVLAALDRAADALFHHPRTDPDPATTDVPAGTPRPDPDPIKTDAPAGAIGHLAQPQSGGYGHTPCQNRVYGDQPFRPCQTPLGRGCGLRIG